MENIVKLIEVVQGDIGLDKKKICLGLLEESAEHYRKLSKLIDEAVRTLRRELCEYELMELGREMFPEKFLLTNKTGEKKWFRSEDSVKAYFDLKGIEEDNVFRR